MPIPKELKENCQWCGWKYEIRDGNKTKVPYNPQTIEKAKPNDPDTFKSFATAEDAYIGGYVDGLGIRVSNGYSAIDIDHCITDGVLSDVAEEICTSMQSYAEKSPSGSGVRIIFKTDDFVYDKEKYYIKNPNNGIEIYTDGATNRFVTITGNTVFGYPVKDNPEALQSILDKYMLRPAKKTVAKFAQETHIAIELPDDELLAKAMRNQSFATLFNGNMAAYNNDHSSADLALCNMLAFWTGKDARKIDFLFRKSALMRDKWNRDDYRNATIDKAIASCTDVYNPCRAQTIWDKLEVPVLQTDNWTVSGEGITHTTVKNKKTGEVETTIVTSTPIAPSAFLENPETGDCKVEIHYLYNNQQRSCVVDKETVLNKTKIVKLANKGINVTSQTANALTKYFSDMERLNANRLPHYLSTSHVGWNGSSFVPYSGNMKFDGEDENASLFQAIAPLGELNDWVEYMRPLRDNLYFRLIMAASFASPLIQPCGCLPFWFHLWGTSGTGKTVALMAAMSVWGNPQMGKLTRTLNATKNAMMSTVSFLHSLPFAGDELQTIKNNYGTYDEIIMQLTEGVERNRMKYDKNLPNRYWHCAFLSTGEEPITSDNSGGGAKNRVIEVEIDNKFFGREGNAIVGFITNNFGSAGRRFIEYIQQSDMDLKSMYQSINGVVLNSINTTDKQALAASLILLADMIACQCLWPESKMLSVEDVAPFIKATEETDIAVRAYEWVKDWIAVNKNRFNGEGYGETWGKMSYDGKTAYIVASRLKDAMKEKGFSFDAVKKKWADNGWVVKYQNSYTRTQSIFGTTPKCVEFSIVD